MYLCTSQADYALLPFSFFAVRNGKRTKNATNKDAAEKKQPPL